MSLRPRHTESMTMTKIRNTCLSGASVVLSALAASIAQAQTPPNIGDALRQVPAAPAPAQTAPALPRLGGTAFEPPLQALPAQGPALQVKAINIVGNREIPTSELTALVAGELGKALTLADLEALASRLTRHYRAKGYFVARVYVPRQEVVDGIVTLRAVEGNYGQFILKNNSRVRDDIVQGMLDDVKKYDIVSLDTLERAMLIINDTPGSKVTRADVMPGQAIGTSDFVVGTEADPEHAGFILLDNHGTRATGKHRASFNWDWNSPTGRGDRLSTSGLVSQEQGLLNGRLGYSVSLAPSGWRGEMALAHTRYEVAADYFDSPTPPDVTGTASSVELGVTYPIRRIRAQTIEAALSYAGRHMEDVVDSGAGARLVTPKKSHAVTAALNIRDEDPLAGWDGVTQASVGVTAGRLSIDGDALLTDQAQAGPHTHGTFSRFNASLSRVSLLPHQFSLSGTLRLQQNLGRNLDHTERLGVTGIGGVMAYPGSELSGSNARQVRIELARPLPQWQGFGSQWSVFTNWGQAQPTRQDDWRSVRDVGLGWTANHPGGALVKAYLAHRLDDQPAQSEKTSRNKFWIQAGYVF